MRFPPKIPPQTITLPPPKLSTSVTQQLAKRSPRLLQTRVLPSANYKLNEICEHGLEDQALLATLEQRLRLIDGRRRRGGVGRGHEHTKVVNVEFYDLNALSLFCLRSETENHFRQAQMKAKLTGAVDGNMMRGSTQPA